MTSKRPDPEALALALAPVTGHLFKDRKRLQRALTHGSARTANAGADYQRFEFLGDRVLGLTIASFLFEAYPTAPEGELSLRLNALVNADTLAEIAEEIGLPDLVHAGADMRARSGQKRVNLRADAMEALIAALYLDGGPEVASAFIHRYWKPRAERAAVARRDAKTELQEWAHREVRQTPTYLIEDRSGPDHDPVFKVSVTIGSLPPAQASGKSKREAEQAAAAAMLQRQGVWDGSEKAR